MIDFPANPTVGQQYTAAGVTWTWDGTKWTASGLGVAYLPLAGGTMLGPIVLAADPAAPLQAATKQYVDANYSGFVNKFRNGTFDVWQRGTSITCPANVWTFVPDGWQVAAYGHAITAQRSGGAASQGGGTFSAVSFSCDPATTAFVLMQNIESYVAAPLVGKRVTFQASFFNASGQPAVAPQIAVGTANAQDNWSSSTVVLAQVAMQSVPGNSTFTRVAYTFDVPVTAINGLEVSLVVSNAPSGFYAVTACDIRATPGWPVGLCANPPPPELRPIATELAFCQRYFEAGVAGALCYGQAGGGVGGWTQFSVTKRALPTVIVANAYNSGNSNSPTGSDINLNGFMNKVNATATVMLYFFNNFSASAEL